MRPHADLIKKWADNEDAEVWVFDGEWTLTKVPTFNKDSRHAVILPEYKEAWQAYLDGEMEFKVDNMENWQAWDFGIPYFDGPPSMYRRAPKGPKVGEKWQHISGVVVVVTGEKSGVVISQGCTDNKLFDYVGTWNWDTRLENWSKVVDKV